jgi:DNA-binding PucR family transcriptional regulator
MRKSPVILLCMMCFACSTTRDIEKDRKDINNALTSPLKDLNLMREKIPEVLLKAEEAPYAIPVATSCKELKQEIHDLNKVLAPDIDQQNKKTSDRLQLSADAVGDASLDAIKRTTESVIPYRSWVRKLTGAERASKMVANAINAGNLRRAFLKGFKAKSCNE